MVGHRKSWLVLTAMALVLAAGLTAGWAAGAGKARPTAVGAVDIQKVLNSLTEKVQVEADLRTRAERLKQEADERKAKLSDLQKDLDVLAAPGSPASQQKQEELEQKSVELQSWATFQQQKLVREQQMQIERLYRKMVDAVGQVAKENSYDLVLYKEGPLDTRNVKPELLGGLLEGRKVLYADADFDITDMVIQRMNNDFKNVTAPPVPQDPAKAP